VGGFFFEFEAIRTEPRRSAQAAEELPPLPDRGDGAKGVLPRVLKNIISKRREVKGLLKKEKNVKKRETYEIRQVADSASLKLQVRVDSVSATPRPRDAVEAAARESSFPRRWPSN